MAIQEALEQIEANMKELEVKRNYESIRVMRAYEDMALLRQALLTPPTMIPWTEDSKPVAGRCWIKIDGKHQFITILSERDVARGTYLDSDGKRKEITHYFSLEPEPVMPEEK